MRNLYDLVNWLEYGRTSGYVAARESKEQEEAWAGQLRTLLGLTRKAMEVVDDDLENRPARHSLGYLYARLKILLERN